MEQLFLMFLDINSSISQLEWKIDYVCPQGDTVLLTSNCKVSGKGYNK